MYTLHIPATNGPRCKPASDIPFATVDDMARWCKRWLVNHWASEGQSFQPRQASIVPALPNGSLAQGGTITVSGACLSGPVRMKTWTFSGPNSAANISDPALDNGGNAG